MRIYYTFSVGNFIRLCLLSLSGLFVVIVTKIVVDFRFVFFVSIVFISVRLGLIALTDIMIYADINNMGSSDFEIVLKPKKYTYTRMSIQIKHYIPIHCIKI